MSERLSTTGQTCTHTYTRKQTYIHITTNHTPIHQTPILATFHISGFAEEGVDVCPRPQELDPLTAEELKTFFSNGASGAYTKNARQKIAPKFSKDA